MRVLAASLVGNPLLKHFKVTVFMDGLKVGPSRTQLFRVHANTMEEEPPSFRRTMSIASARASLPVNKGSVSCMSTSKRCEYSLHLWDPLPEHIKVTVFMDGLKVGPSRTQLFRAHANTMEEAIQIALQEEYRYRQARTPTSSSIRCYGCGKLGHMQRACPAGGQRKFPSKPRGSRGPWQKPRPKSQGNWGHHPHGKSADGARHGGLAPESLGALETRKSSGGLLVVHASGDPFRVLIDSGASTNFARRQTVARNGDKYADALRESKGRGQVGIAESWGVHEGLPGGLEGWRNCGYAAPEAGGLSEDLNSSSVVDENVLKGFTK
ncbi:LOW QUALITY PROTEIN: Gag protein [Phytophthora palmivora]|uniref:Gag protein n=1 Tax=Phytophthora palmivora TaxID=4796 RepID=A0A2P4XUP0_9STRA|nr:LOW QUALITY PROTEIN: Gag protein [Phytophthora palmivora]